MKYIRTKDEIFEVIKEDGDWIDCVGSLQRIMKCQCCVKKHAVIKQADTIEELCDRYIVVYGKLYTIYKKKAFNRTNHRLLCLDIRDGKKECYGAIWTDKGLNYVAKLNDKGELELL